MRKRTAEKERIYVCHTYYHVYVTCLKELTLPKEMRGHATLVLSTLSNDFGNLKERAEKRGRRLEILFHPGTVLAQELGEEFCNHGANEFHVSEGRHVEYEAVMSLCDEDLQ